jgi:hypothetical protein
MSMPNTKRFLRSHTGPGLFLLLFLWAATMACGGDSAPADFSATRKGLADGSFVPLAFQRPNGLVSQKNGVWEISNVRWNVKPVAGTPWYAVPHTWVTARIDPRKARHVYIAKQSVTPLFIHSFLVVSFEEGGLVANGRSSQGLVLDIEPLLRHDQHSWKVPVGMMKGVYPKLYQLSSWENYSLFIGEVMKQMAWLRPLRSKDPKVVQRLVEALLQSATAAPATQQFDYGTNNCGAGLFPMISAALPKNEADSLARVLKASSKPNFARWFQKHLEQAGLLDDTKPVRIYRDSFFVPLEDLCKGFFPPAPR